jgi:hypothetical protein
MKVMKKNYAEIANPRKYTDDVTLAGMGEETAAEVIEKLEAIRNDYGIDYDEFMALVSNLFND